MTHIVTLKKIMYHFSFFMVFLLIANASFAQKSHEGFHNNTRKKHYIPLDLMDGIRVLNEVWPDSTHQAVQVMSESDFSGTAHFGIGLWIRNHWGLWGGSRLAKYFKNLGVHHPDDMSGIILTSYHRQLKGEEIRLDQQIRSYQSYWTAMKEPHRRQYPTGVRKLDFTTRMLYQFNQNTEWGCVFVSDETSDGLQWIYDARFGWQQVNAQELAILQEPETRYQNVKQLFGSKD
ncbi:MAG: DUF6794 domain-containing protein [Bacteroidota bacterium]